MGEPESKAKLLFLRSGVSGWPTGDRRRNRDDEFKLSLLEWIVDRIKLLAQSFTIGICAYAVLSNHHHIVLKVDKNQSLNLTEDEVIARWTAIYPSGLILIKRYLEGKASADEVDDAKSRISVWRDRLPNISWFMSALNHNIACRANKEDDCKGRFWESRFTSQALLDDTAILSCMAYVDLNPVRAGIAQELIDSDFTSIQERIKAFKQAQQAVEDEQNDQVADSSTKDDEAWLTSYQPESLLAFGTSNCQNKLCFSLVDYLDLVDWTGRSVRSDKKGFIDADVPELVKQLGISEQSWLELSQRFDK